MPRLTALLAVLLTALIAGTAQAVPRAGDASPVGSELRAAAADPADTADDTEEIDDDDADGVRDPCDVHARVADSAPATADEDDGSDLDEADDPNDYVTCDEPDPAQVLAGSWVTTPKTASLAATLKRGRLATGAVLVPGAATVTQSLTLPGRQGRRALFLGRARRTITEATTLKFNVKLTKRGRAALKRRAGKPVAVRLTTTIKVTGRAAKITHRVITLRD